MRSSCVLLLVIFLVMKGDSARLEWLGCCQFEVVFFQQEGDLLAKVFSKEKALSNLFTIWIL